MQLILSSMPFAKPPVVPPPAGSQRRPCDTAAMSQLDQIAAQNLQPSRQGLGASALLLALVGGLVVLGSASMWSEGNDASRKPSAAVAEARQAPAADVAVLPAPVAAAVAPQAAAVVEPAAPATLAEQALTAAVAAAPVATVDDAARKARAAKAADARRKAAQLAQERALAEEETQRLQLAQQRDAERSQQQLTEQARQRAAAEQARLASLQLAANTRRSVADSCAGAGNFFSQQFCRSRECGKAEHQGDGVCVNLREAEAARLRASAER